MVNTNGIMVKNVCEIKCHTGITIMVNKNVCQVENYCQNRI